MTPRSLYGYIAAFALAVFAPVGMVLYGLRALRVYTRRIHKEVLPVRWLVVWSALLIPFLGQAFAGQVSFWLLGTYALGLLAGSVLRGKDERVAAGFMVALGFSLLALMVERHVSATTWSPPEETVTWDRLQANFRGEQLLEAQDSYTAYERSWQLREETEHIRLTFQARLISGEPGWEWQPYHPAFRLEQQYENSEPFTRVRPPENDNSYITRRLNTKAPIAGRTFRTTLELRAPEGFEAEGCGGILLREELGTYARECFPVTLNEAWQALDLVWTPPPEANSPVIRLELRLAKKPYDVRSVRLFERVSGQWLELKPLEPTGALLSFFLPGVERQLLPSFGFTPSETWQTYTFDLNDVRLADLERLRAYLRLEGNLNVEVRDMILTSPGANPKPLPTPPRQQLWHPQPNLTGHTLATLGLVATSLAPSFWLGIGSGFLSLAGVYLSGSRTAWVALLLGLPWLLGLVFTKRRSRLLAAFTIVFLVVFATVSQEGMNRFKVWQGDTNSVSRTTIWRAAEQALYEHPWLGLRGTSDSFADYWTTRVNDGAVTHAHNLWLEFAVRYGFPGLIAILWITVGLLYLAWSWGRWRGLALVMPVLLMNMFDYTLFYSSVLLPLILGLNLLHEDD